MTATPYRSQPHWARAAEPEPEPERVPVDLPDQPRTVRVWSPGRHPRDWTVHPDGTLTTIATGRVWTLLGDFEWMLASSWVHSRLEWDPDGPLPPLVYPTGGHAGLDEGEQHEQHELFRPDTP